MIWSASCSNSTTHIVEKQRRLEEAAHQRFQLEFQQRPVILVGNCPPGLHALLIRRQGTQPCGETVADHHRHVGVEQVADFFLVGLDLVEGIPDVGLLVGRVLQLDHRQRQAVDEGHQVRATRLFGAAHGELADQQEIVIARLGKVDQVNQIAALLVAPFIN